MNQTQHKLILSDIGSWHVGTCRWYDTYIAWGGTERFEKKDCRNHFRI